MTKVFLLHGWSVTSTETYRSLHQKLGEHGWDLHDVNLGRYVSLDDEISIRDLARALQNALIDSLGVPPWTSGVQFITHSTGALILREWIVHHYVGESLEGKPVGNIVFLAGPHGGSRLAHHGRSMLASVRFLGDTGRTLLRALELGSEFTWKSNGEWMDTRHWLDKGIRPFCLSGDRVVTDTLLKRIFSAGREKGSDMVVRVPSANMNMRRFRLEADTRQLEYKGEVRDVPFGALWRYTHSGPEYGIMNSIDQRADPQRDEYQNLSLLLKCLSVNGQKEYAQVREDLAEHSRSRRNGPFAQLVFQFIDQDGEPINDYRVVLGRGENESAEGVEHVHKNHTDPSRLVVFVDTSKIDKRYGYFLEIHAETGSPLTEYAPEDFRVEIERRHIDQFIRKDEVTEIEVVLPRAAKPALLRFDRADEVDGIIEWNREGEPRR